MQYLTIYPTSINERALERAAGVLRDGGLIVYPTDTIYALGCDALNLKAVERLCRAKGLNPDKNLLSVVCSDISQASEYARIDNRAFALLKRCLPGPFTFVLPASSRLPKQFKGRKTVGIRVPGNAIATSLAEALGHPILSSSVKVSDDFPEEAANPESLEMAYAEVADLIIDGGEGGIIPSTIVDLADTSDPQILRQGKGSLA